MARLSTPTAASSDKTAEIQHNHLVSPRSKGEDALPAKQVIIVTGASSGFGAMTVRALADAGHDVYAGMRDIAGRNAKAAQEAADYASEQSVDLRAIEMDVSEQASVDAAVQTIISTEERLDVIVHNAGHMVLGPLESFTTDQLMSIYDTNVLSTQRLNRAALPHLRNQRDGLVVWVGSTSTRGGNRGNIRGVRGGRGGQPVRRNQPPASASAGLSPEATNRSLRCGAPDRFPDRRQLIRMRATWTRDASSKPPGQL